MDRLRREAERQGVSLAQLVREAVDRLIPPEADAHRSARRRLLEVAGRYDSGEPDIAERHDDALGELDRW